MTLRLDRAALLAELEAAGADVRNPGSFCCPFHEDHNPSAGVHRDDVGVWRFKCHGCGFGGDLFDVRAMAQDRSVVDVLREFRRSNGGAARPSSGPGVVVNAAHLEPLAAELGVSVAALAALGITRNGRVWLCPERSASGTIIGTAKRLDDGRKIMMKGSKRGLCFAQPFAPSAGKAEAEPVLVVEGMSDAAAGMTSGFVTVGRPSADGGLPHLKALLNGRHVVIVGENDAAGRNGAEKIAAGLRSVAASVVIIYPPADVKDLRAWLAQGCTRAVLLDTIHKARRNEAAPSDLILDPGDPVPAAREFLARRYTDGQHWTMHHRGDIFYAWTGSAYGKLDDAAVRAELYRFTELAVRWVHRGEAAALEAFKPTTTKTNLILDALKAMVNLPVSVSPPAWLANEQAMPSARDLLACRNGLLHLPTGKLIPPTPLFFGVNGVEYAYEPDAPVPAAWLDFVTQLWPGDEQAVDTLQELMGLMLVPDTSHHKIFLIVGPKRAGKGTIARILTAMVGRGNVCAPTLASLQTNFGLWPLIDKTLAIIGDARLGGRADQHAIAERLLSITGEDTQTIDRKHREPWTGTLPTRFLILTNELPRLADASGTLASRFVVLTLERSFFGEEDRHLAARLMAELPGILNWSIAGWRRLNGRGRFEQPSSSAGAMTELEDLGSPVAAFVRDCCIVQSGASVECGRLYAAWCAWSKAQGREHPGTVQTFGRDLKAIVPPVRKMRPRSGPKRIWFYDGVDLDPESGAVQTTVQSNGF